MSGSTWTYVGVGAVCIVVVSLAGVVLLRVAHRFTIVDVPNARSSHARPVPRTGGLALVAAVVLASAFAGWQGVDVGLFALLGTLGLAAVGFIDDLANLPALPRLALQCALGAGVGFTVGGLPGALALAVAVPVATNIINFMDGINAITCLTLGCWGINATFIGVSGGSPALTVVAIMVTTGCLAFLPFNFPRAAMFLGDAGSYLLGGMVSMLAGGAWWRAEAHSLLAAALLWAPLAVYAADTGTTIVRRLAAGENVLSAHRDHVYQRLVHQRGLSHGAAAFLVAGTSAGVTGAAHAGWWPVVGILLVAYLALPWGLGRLGKRA